MANKPENLKQWVPGQAPYADYLKSLTPEQKALHLKQRKERKAMKVAMKEVVEEYQHKWIAELHNAAWAQLVKARESGDTQAFVAVWDRIVGKPQESDFDANSMRPLPWTDKDL
jgi:cell division inhibitor SulA